VHLYFLLNNDYFKIILQHHFTYLTLIYFSIFVKNYTYNNTKKYNFNF